MDTLPIPRPQVLDPDRLLRDDREHQFSQDHRPPATVLDDALHESCAYAEQLWNELNHVRQYLLDALPLDPHVSDSPTRCGAAPTGPDDELGWQHWMSAFSAVTSVLCGPHGDSGFGMSRAREEAQRRRAIVTTDAETGYLPGGGQRSTASTGARQRIARSAGLAVLATLALRGLLPRRRCQTR